MKKFLLLVIYGVGAGLFARFFSAPLYYVFLILFFGGLTVLVFGGRWLQRNSALKDMFWLISSFLWLANIFGFIANGLNFTLGIFLTFLVVFLILWMGLSRVERSVPATSASVQLSEPPQTTPVVVQPDARRTFVYGFSGALIIAEFFWAVAFLPFEHLTLAGLVFIIFYLIWTIFYHHFQESLSREILFKNLAFGVAMIAVLLLSVKWQP